MSNRILAAVGLAGLLLTSNAALAQTRVVQKYAIGCESRDHLEKIIEYSQARDYSAADKAINDLRARGLCKYLTEGTTVQVVDTALLSRMVRIRERGELQEWWMPSSMAR